MVIQMKPLLIYYNYKGDIAMNAVTVRRSNRAMKTFEYNINKMLRDIDRYHKSKGADDDIMSKKFQGADENGNRSYGPF